MNKFYFIIFGFILILVGLSVNHYYQKEIVYYELSTYEEIKELLEKESTIIIDVRGENSFFSGHIRGSINIPYLTIIDGDLDPDFEKDTYYLLYDDGGNFSAEASAHMAFLGYENVYYFSGLELWEDVIDVVESSEN